MLFMTPGLALFYGGMVRSKNVLGIMIQNFAAIAVVGVIWAAIGYTSPSVLTSAAGCSEA